MLVQNETPFCFRFLSLERAEDEVQAVLIVKSTFEGGDGHRLVPAAEQVPIVNDQLETPFGIFHTDCYVRKAGIDVCVLGTVRRARPLKTTELRLAAGDHQTGLTVFGDRRWTNSGTQLAPSDPVSFEEMPIAYSHAFGGSTEHDHETVVLPDNPIGRGYYLAEEKAVGQPLPNIEPANGPRITDWTDRPPVAGWGPYPLFWGIRAREGVDVSGVTKDDPLPRVKPELNNHAHPSLVLPRLEQGSVLRVEGMREHELVWEVPVVRPAAHITVGDKTFEAEGRFDGVFVWADSGRLTLTHRLHFRYHFQPREQRRLTLFDASAGTGV